ncbi:restriction endonuclease subunit S [Riemerella anatipestifer]|uniref:restriction endonuclease subunit S n=1 Tax=Riemerella anatipestifer TaxID=34085 RepID=UPI00129ECEBE|nr:restriction endonuclease subunit S [Riemerella anatipestifer]MDR7694819.1 restriction endonuclease subunit S [Riemerella anatipestifer]MDR7794975.1 restriction endonuclease subunit S [Riemerella anatipestifer]MRN16571.1 restriction endonuclease subunit S [Riemerella anatipestifer]
MKDKLPKGWEWKTLELVCDRGSSNISQNQIQENDGDFAIYGASGFIKNINFYHQSKPYIGIVKDGTGVGRVMLLEAKTSVIGTLQYLIPRDNVDLKYLYYFLLGIDFNKYVSGSTIPHIYYKNYKNEPFLFIPISEQKQIVSVLDKTFEKLDQAITLVEENIQKLKQLNESVLDVVFKNKPKNWKTDCLKKLTTKIGSGSTPTGGQNSYKESGISLIRSLNVHDWGFKEKNLAFIDEVQAKKISNVEIENNDVLLNITGASVARCCIVPENIIPARVNQHVSILRIKKELLLPKFLHYSLISPFYKNQLLYNSSGGATREALSKSMLEKFEINYPTIIEQQHIVAYLDQTTKKNQKLTQYYQDKLEALKRLKNSVLDSAFKGELRREKIVSFSPPVIDPYFARSKKFNAKKNADKQAMVIAISIEAHEKLGKFLYRTKGEKTVEVIEKHLDLDFGREAEKMTAGPADFKHLVNVVEPLANEKKWFYTQEIKGENYDSHKYIKAENFNPFMMRCVQDLKPNLDEIRRIINLFADIRTTHEVEVITTTYTGWNNLLIRKVKIDNNAIVSEARENWHEAKLKIDRQEFFDAIDWLKNNNLIPQGNGKEVN